MAINLDGTSQYISLGAGVDIYRTRPFSAFALVNGDNLSSGVEHGILSQGNSGASWVLYKATNDYTYLGWNSGGSYAVVTNQSYIGQGWVLIGFAMRDTGSYTQVESYLYVYNTRTLSQYTEYFKPDADPPAPGGSLTTIGARGISSTDADWHWPGLFGWAGVWSEDLSGGGLANPPKVWTLIQDPYTLIDSSCRLFMPMLRSTTKDLSPYALHGTNVGGAGFVGGGPTELPAPGVIVVTTDAGGGAQAVTSPTISAGSSLAAPTVAPGAVTLTGATLASGAVLRAPVVAPGSVTLTGATIATGASLAAPTVTPVQSLAVPAISTGATLAAPSLAVGAVTLSAPTIATGATLASPALAQTLSLPTLASGATLAAPSAAQNLSAPAISSGASLSAPTVAPGAVTLALPTISAGSALTQPALGSSFELTGAFISAGALAFAPTVSQTLALPTLSSGATLAAPALGTVLQASALSSGAALYAPTISVGAVTLEPPTVGTTAVLWALTISAAGAQSLTGAFIATGTVLWTSALAGGALDAGEWLFDAPPSGSTLSRRTGDTASLTALMDTLTDDAPTSTLSTRLGDSA